MRHCTKINRHRVGSIESAPWSSRLMTGVTVAFLAGGVATAGVGISADAAPDTATFQSAVAPSAPPVLSSPAQANAEAQPADAPSPQDIPPLPGAAEVPTTPATPAPAPGDAGESTAVLGPVLPPSLPTDLAIDIIGVSSGLMELGLEDDGTVSVPPGDADSPAGWYENSPTPGELGSSVILGHVNSTQTGIGVFYRLHELADSDQVSVTRADGTVAVFQVYRVDTYDKASFPAAEVYGNADRAELRLITCGGFDPSTGEFDQNVVAYAYLISTDQA